MESYTVEILRLWKSCLPLPLWLNTILLTDWHQRICHHLPAPNLFFFFNIEMYMPAALLPRHFKVLPAQLCQIFFASKKVTSFLNGHLCVQWSERWEIRVLPRQRKHQNKVSSNSLEVFLPNGPWFSQARYSGDKLPGATFPPPAESPQQAAVNK